MGVVLHLNKLAFLSLKDALCWVWLKLAQSFLRKRFLNFVNVLSLLRNYLPFEKVMTLNFNKLESPSPKDALCRLWLNLAQWVLKKMKMRKFTRKDRRTTDNRRSENLTWAFRSGELKRYLCSFNMLPWWSERLSSPYSLIKYNLIL